jgi:hypothetical protein
MQIDELKRILRLPEVVEEQHGDWLQTEEKLGIVLPTDYKQFTETYGSGQIDHFLSIFNPFSKCHGLELCGNQSTILNSLRFLIDKGEKCPFLLYPEPSGILPFGATDNGDILYWVTDGAPDAWWIVVNESRGPKFEEFHCNMVTFLTEILSRRVTCRLFPESFPATT